MASRFFACCLVGRTLACLKDDHAKSRSACHEPPPVKDRVAAMSLEYAELRFTACENTRTGMAKREGKDVPLLKEANSVPSGVIR